MAAHSERLAVLDEMDGNLFSALENIARLRADGTAFNDGLRRLEQRWERREETLTTYGERLAVLDRDRTTRDSADDSNRSLKRDLIVAVVNILLGVVVAYVVSKKS